MSLRRTVWGSQPSPAPRRPAQRGPGRAAHPDGRPGPLHGPGADAQLVRPASADPASVGYSSLSAAASASMASSSPATPLVEGRPEDVELLVDVAGPHADDHAAPRQDVQGGELLGGPQRVALGGDVDVGHEPDPGRDPGQPPQGGDGVVPGGAHGPRQPARDGGVVAHRHVEEAAVLGRLGARASSAGFCNFYQRFIQNYSAVARPLFNLTRKNTPFVWGTDQENAFRTLVTAFTTAPVLLLPDHSKPFRLITDASEYALGQYLNKPMNSTAFTQLHIILSPLGPRRGTTSSMIKNSWPLSPPSCTSVTT